MKERNVTITLDKAREWYNSGNESLKEIAEHFSRYFGTLITEAKYGDLKGFEIIN